jgi:hypothetical protein
VHRWSLTSPILTQRTNLNRARGAIGGESLECSPAELHEHSLPPLQDRLASQKEHGQLDAQMPELF